MKKTVIIIILILIFIAGLVYFGYYKNQRPLNNLSTTNTPSPTDQLTESDIAIQKAKAIFQELKSKGVDFSNGPCIAEDLMPNWVADVAHNPRQPIDNLPQNQCQNFRNGKAKHFVELDPNGNIIKVY
jgi:outer membrane PBP1 activator LpoA protein